MRHKIVYFLERYMGRFPGTAIFVSDRRICLNGKIHLSKLGDVEISLAGQNLNRTNVFAGRMGWTIIGRCKNKDCQHFTHYDYDKKETITNLTNDHIHWVDDSQEMPPDLAGIEKYFADYPPQTD